MSAEKKVQPGANCLCCGSRLCAGSERLRAVYADRNRLRKELAEEKELTAYLLGEQAGRERRK